MLALFSLICITLILSVIVLIDPIIANECIDTVGWHDKINNSTCSDYVVRGWCINKTLSSSLQNNSIPSLNFPELNCCECGKKASLKLSPTAQWVQYATTVAGAVNATSGSSLAMLNYNFGIYIADDDTLYIADYDNNRVVLIQRNSTTAMAVIGQGSQSNMFTFNCPADVSVTRTSIYIMDAWNFRVQKWSRNLSNPVTVAGVSGVNGSSTDMTKLSDAYNLFVDNYANLFVGDYDNHRVMMFPWNSTSGTSGLIVGGTGVRGSGSNQLNGPSGLFVTDNGTLYITDYGNHRIQKWIIGDTAGETVAGTGTAGNGLSQLNFPNTVLVDLNGYMYITDGNNNRIIRWAPGANVGECIAACSGNSGIAPDRLNIPTSMAFDSGGSLYVNDNVNNRVQKFQILIETTQSTTSLGSNTTQSTVSTTSQSTTQTKTTTAIQSTLSTTNMGQNTTQTATTTATETMSSTSMTHSEATLIKPSFFVISIILFFSIHSLM